MSHLFARTLRDDPADAEVASHRLLVRAGYVRRVSPGVFSWLPLGLVVLRRIEAVVREEMDRIGAQEVLLPALLPKEPYEKTGRWTEYGPSLFRLQDRRGVDNLLGPTHEEIFTTLVKGEAKSHRDFPVALYQIQTKFRDEVRPRAGILRGREFVMKDSYSFDLDEDGLAVAYGKHRDAYIEIFRRLGIEAIPVSAMSGAMGGSASEEFLAPSEAGEDDFVDCAACGYAANVEAVETRAPVAPEGEVPALQVLDTPDTPTIVTLVDRLNADGSAPPAGSDTWTAAHTLKNVLVVLEQPDGTTEPLAVGVPGDREVDTKRIEAQLSPATVRPFTEADFAATPALVKGYIGPGVLGGESATGIRYLVDPLVAVGTEWVTGANRPGEHAAHVVRGRDFTPDGEIRATEVRAGDPCPVCGEPLRVRQGIEIGHVFQLGTKYSEAFGLTMADKDGVNRTVTMGSYGIGVSRAVATIVEQHHDDKGIVWPPSVAPADVHVVVAGKDDERVAAGEDLGAALSAAGLRVLLDDRRESPGVKMKDAELIGVPVSVIVGRRLSEGIVEVRTRATMASEDVALADIVPGVRRALDAATP